jgi:outer membrane immunogenic protein
MSVNKYTLMIGLVLVSFSAIADEGSSESAHNWRGFYAGGFLGGAFSTKSDAILCGTPEVPETPCNPSGNVISYDFQTNSNQSIIGGAQIGYIWQVEHPQGYKWLPSVWGLEAEYGRLDYQEGSLDGIVQVDAFEALANPLNNIAYELTLKNYGFIGGRIGYAVDRALIYFKGGAVITDMKTRFCSGEDRNCQDGNPSVDDKSSSLGYALGGGIEYALPWGGADKWSIKAEYLMMNLPSLATVGVGTKYGVPPASYPFNFAIYQEMNNFRTGKIAINYHF